MFYIYNGCKFVSKLVSQIKKSANSRMIRNADPADEKKSAKGDIRENADPAGEKSQQKVI